MDGIDQVSQVPPQPVEFPDHQRIPLAYRLQTIFKSRPIVAVARGSIFIEVPGIDTGLAQGITLQIGNLAAIRFGLKTGLELRVCKTPGVGPVSSGFKMEIPANSYCLPSHFSSLTPLWKVHER
jgi:hypothetical protein